MPLHAEGKGPGIDDPDRLVHTVGEPIHLLDGGKSAMDLFVDIPAAFPDRFHFDGFTRLGHFHQVVQQTGWSGTGGFTLRWYGQILLGTATRFGSTYRTAVFNSIRIAAGASVLAIVLGTPIAWTVSRRPSGAGGLLEVLKRRLETERQRPAK